MLNPTNNLTPLWHCHQRIRSDWNTDQTHLLKNEYQKKLNFHINGNSQQLLENWQVFIKELL